MVRVHPYIVHGAVALVLVATAPLPALAQNANDAARPPCTLVGLNDFAAAGLPRPQKIIVTAGPDQTCQAVYGTGPLVPVITVQFAKPVFAGMPFSQKLQACHELTPPCEPVLGVGEQAYYQRSGRPAGPGSTQQVLASLHGRIISVLAVGMATPATKSSLTALARGVARRTR